MNAFVLKAQELFRLPINKLRLVVHRCFCVEDKEFIDAKLCFTFFLFLFFIHPVFTPTKHVLTQT